MKQILFIALLAVTAISVKAQDTTYYDAHSKRLDTPDSAAYKSIRIPDLIDSTIVNCKIYSMSGQIRKEIKYRVVNSKPVYIGRYAEWYSNGVLKYEANYVDGKKDGDETTFDENKKLIKCITFQKGNQIKELDVASGEYLYSAVDKMPEYDGGEKALINFINSILRYPSVALRANVQGRVIARFAIAYDGTVRDDVTILKGIGSGCDEEVIRVIKKMPRWIPGRQGGKPVAVWYTLPVMFTISK